MRDKPLLEVFKAAYDHFKEYFPKPGVDGGRWDKGMNKELAVCEQLKYQKQLWMSKDNKRWEGMRKEESVEKDECAPTKAPVAKKKLVAKTTPKIGDNDEKQDAWANKLRGKML